MPSHAIDSPFLKHLYSTEAMRSVFNETSLLQKWLDTEAALARAEAKLGLVPLRAAREISRVAQAKRMDSTRIAKDIAATAHPIVPVIRELARHCRSDAGEYIHWGATTQDIMDTATALQLKEAIAILEGRASRLGSVLSKMARKYRSTVMAGRTHGQHALPITFGFKLGVWLAEVQRHQQRLTQAKPRVLVGQFSGAVGTLASVAKHGERIQRLMMKDLGLGVPPIAWHTARDGICELASIAGLLAGIAGKIANEIIALQKTEIGELEEPFHTGKVGSSTMPHKRNPMLCEAVVATSKVAMNEVANAFDNLIQEHERDWAAWTMEASFVPQIFIMTDGALSLITNILKDLQVNPKRMRRNLDISKGLILSEKVMMVLAEKVGRQTAHDMVYQCAMQAFEQQRPFIELLAKESKIEAHFDNKALEKLLDPERYTGLSEKFVDNVLALNGSGSKPRARSSTKR